MSFDRLARHYRWMEWLLAGGKLQRCRIAFLDSLPTPSHALLLGEGHGRFLTELLRKFPEAQVTCVDASRGMIDQATRRLERSGTRVDNIRFLHADILQWEPPRAEFDVIVSNFFFDCFRASQLRLIAEKISRASTAEAQLLLADFCEPESGPAKWRARLILSLMYRFFRVVTDLPAGRLVCPKVFLRQNRFELRERLTFEWGLLYSELWCKA